MYVVRSQKKASNAVYGRLVTGSYFADNLFRYMKCVIYIEVKGCSVLDESHIVSLHLSARRITALILLAPKQHSLFSKRMACEYSFVKTPVQSHF